MRLRDYKNVILWKGKSPYNKKPIVALVACVTYPSKNRKTGPMYQLYILSDTITPNAAAKKGDDDAVCGTCPLKFRDGKQRGCYVALARGCQKTWEYYKKPGAYISELILPKNRAVRLGAYGDPAMVPLERLRQIVEILPLGSTGYTHQWRWCDPRYAELCMASTEIGETEEAMALGYRCFTVVPEGERPPKGHIQCPATRLPKGVKAEYDDEGALVLPEGIKMTQCYQCMLCSGSTGRGARAKNIWVPAHGLKHQMVYWKKGARHHV